MKSPVEILRLLIEKLILPKYPFLKLYDIETFTLSHYIEYDVRFKVKNKLDPQIQMEIDSEVKNIFKAASLDTKEKHRRNVAVVWFKTPNARDWSFMVPPGYNHIQ